MAGFHSLSDGLAGGGTHSLWSPKNTSQTVSMSALMDHTTARINAQDHCGNTALIVAASMANEQAVRSLLKRGAAVDAKNNLGTTALMEACRQGSVSIVKLLLQNKADALSSNAIGASPLAIAVDNEHEDVVRALLENGADVNGEETGELCGRSTRRSVNAASPLMMACRRGNTAIVELLLRRGADVNQKLGATGWTCLMIAASYGYNAVCQILMQRGADAEARNACGRNAWDITGSNVRAAVRHTEAVQSASDGTAGSIFEAAKAGDSQAVQDILTVDRQRVSSCDKDGGTPLMFAALQGHLQVVEVLVKAGADVNAQDFLCGWTALMQATYYGRTVVAVYLVENGADVSIQAKDNSTAFEMAMIIGDTFLTRLLAKHSMKVSKRDEKVTGKKQVLFQRQGSRTSQNASNATSAKGDVKDPLPVFLGVDEDSKAPSNFKKWLSGLSTKFKKATTSKVIDESMVPTSSSRPLSPTGEPISKRFKQPGLQRQMSLPWGGQKSLSPQRMRGDSLTAAGADSGAGFALPPTFPPEGDKNDQLATEALPANDRMAGRLHPDLHTPIIPPFRPSAAFDSNRGPGNLENDDVPGAEHLLQSPNNDRMPAAAPVRRAISSSSLNNSGGSMSRQTSMVRPSRKNSSSNMAAASTPSNSSTTTGAKLASNKLTVHHVQERNRQTEEAPANLLNGDASSSPSKRSSSLDFLPQRAVHRQPIKSRHATGPTSPSPSTATSSTNTPTSPGWTSHGQYFFGQTPLASVPQRHRVSSSALSRGSSEGTGSTISVERSTSEDAFGQMLRKLKLTKYRAIFEDQEVDVETFLTLTDGDLQELGIQSGQDRRQILQGIAEHTKLAGKPKS